MPEAGNREKGREYWAYSCGGKGISRVRVYERSVSSCLYIEWHLDGKRNQRSFKSFVGYSVTDKSLAEQIAEEFSRKLEQHGNRMARQFVFGDPIAPPPENLADPK